MKLLVNDKQEGFIVARRRDVIELVDITTGEIREVERKEFEQKILPLYNVKNYSPNVSPLEIRFEDREDEWLEELREKRSHIVEEARKVKRKGKKKGEPKTPRKKKSPAKHFKHLPPPDIQKKVDALPESMRADMLKSLGY